MCAYLKSKRDFNVKSSTNYFHVKTEVSEDLQICISMLLSLLSVPLRRLYRTSCLRVFFKIAALKNLGI